MSRNVQQRKVMQKCCKLSTLRNLCATSFWHVSLAYGVDLNFSYKVFWICRARFTALPDLSLCLKVGWCKAT